MSFSAPKIKYFTVLVIDVVKGKLIVLFVTALQCVQTIRSKDPLWTVSCERVKAINQPINRGTWWLNW